MYVTIELGLGGRSLLWHRGLDDFDQGAEGSRIADRHFAQDLAIEFNLCGLETVDELAITEAVHLGSGAQTDDPQTTEVTLAATTIAKCINARADQRFLGGAE